MDTPWLLKRQQAYDRFAKEAWLVGTDRAMASAFDLHQAIVAKVDALPMSEGGRQVWT